MAEQGSGDARLTIVTPVLNDWECLQPLMDGLAAAGAEIGELRLLVVDDGSTTQLDPEAVRVPDAFTSVEIIHLGCNLGHQRAIAAGLVEVSRRADGDAVLVIDADGEDRPQDAMALWNQHLASPTAIVVGQRRSRSEAIRFRMFYALYKVLFRLLTGKVLDFGNFALVPASAATRLTRMTELWNHFPSTIMRSRVPIVKVPLDRQPRFHGSSRMNFTALVNHGLAAIAAFNDAVFVRLIVVASALAVMFGVLAVAAFGVQATSESDAAGGMSALLGFAFLGVVQVLAMLAVVTFLALAARATASMPPQDIAPRYITSIERLR